MARTREYDRQDVLDTVTRIFWARGFEATAMSRIVDETHLNTASLYKEFGGKEGLFEAALENYQKNHLELFIKPLIEKPGMMGINKFLANIIDGAEVPDFKGCLFMNSLTEKDVIATGAIRRVEKFCIRLETALENAICGAQKSGQIPPRKNPAALASFISCMVHGIVLYGRTDDNRAKIRSIVRTIKDALKA